MIKLPISRFEKRLIYRIANDWSHPRLDKLMTMISDPYQWLFPTLTFSMILVYLNWETGILALFIGGLGAGAADGINARLIKPNTDRIRPGKQFDDVRSLGTMNKGLKSFPSNHASNTMAIALGFTLILPWVGWILIPLSLLVGYSRVYCGAHFPLDVITGWAHGAFWVSLIYWVLTHIQTITT